MSHRPSTEFKSFSEDHPGEQCIVMKGRFGEDETIKMEATMFDGFMYVLRTGLDASGSDIRLHISLLTAVKEFLRVRGIYGELCFFLHEYMMNKDRIELING
ncbi:hypothetical protein HID58_040558 [Brassica napus]|uniref:Uncharacterized protein n=1 Tax=Brassica napus TaxID=3708 RepID=A0ABQ8B8F3_BRANA|nr:hypothetical protein HID58_040558 [Brassica napus]